MAEQVEGISEKGQNHAQEELLKNLEEVKGTVSEVSEQIQMPDLNDESFWKRFRQDFWRTIKSVAKMVGKVVREVIKQALTLYHSLWDDDTPSWARMVIFRCAVLLHQPS